MFRTRTPSSRDRRAVILLVVVTLLTLFAVVGISFVLYSENTASSMRMWRESGQGGHTRVSIPNSRGNPFEEPPIPEDIFNRVLGDVIYDVPDDTKGVHSAVRGHSLARLMYGWKGNDPTLPLNLTPYNGYGRFTFTNAAMVQLAAGAPLLPPVPRINYTYQPGAGGGVWDPERATDNPRLRSSDPYNGTYIAKNAPYTSPDVNNFYLGVIRASDGKVLVPSFFRPDLLNPNPTPGTPWNAWTQGGGITAAHFANVVPNRNYRPVLLRPQGGGGLPGPFLASPNPNFPLPYQNADGSWGDVENLEGKLAMTLEGTPMPRYDSFWMDVDLPVRMWRGKFYKPLVAMLITDLDGRINFNVAGNLRGDPAGTPPAPTHASYQGWGPWEINLRKVLEPPGQTNPNVYANLVQQLLTHPAQGRYAQVPPPPGPHATFATSALMTTNQLPRFNEFTAPPTTPPDPAQAPFYANYDLDAGGNGQIMLPNNTQLQTSPNFGARFGNGKNAERDNHPALFNPYLANSTARKTPMSPQDRIFGLYDMFLLNYKYNTDDANYARAEVAQILPGAAGGKNSLAYSVYPGTTVPNGGDFAPPTQNPRFLVTALSNDLQRLAVSPWKYRAGNYTLTTAGGIPGTTPGTPPWPTGPTNAHPAPTDTMTIPNPLPLPLGTLQPQNTEFNSLYQNNLAQTLGALNLGQRLRRYTATNHDQINRDREKLALEVFHRLVAATGAGDLTVNATTGAISVTPGARNTPQFDAHRWLAQLAVNIVDYIDEDDVMTVLKWDPTGNPDDYVVGTELPRLVVNESYVRIENDPADPGPMNTDPAMRRATRPYKAKLWLELHNPLTPADNNQADTVYNQGNADLAGYQLKIAKRPPQNLRSVENVTGDPTFATTNPPPLPATDVVTVPLSGLMLTQVPPNTGAAYNGASFPLFGPEALPGGAGPALSATVAAMTWDIPVAEIPGMNMPQLPNKPAFLLQRLADPGSAPGPTNPWVTVDYTEYTVDAQMNVAVQYDAAGQHMPPPNLMNEASWGRVQPYAGRSTQGLAGGDLLVAQNPTTPPAFKHTFTQHNGQGTDAGTAGGTLVLPFEWLVHLDRPLVSPVELFNVSAHKPSELTQWFFAPEAKTGMGPRKPQQHLAQWQSDDTRLYRVLEYLQTPSRFLGMGFGGRIPGRININTIADRQTFRALCDRHGDHLFQDTHVDQAWDDLVVSRDGADKLPGTSDDRPFLGIATPIQNTPPPSGGAPTGLADSLLRLAPPPPAGGTPPTTGLFVPRLPSGLPQQAHPYLQQELFGKIFNNLTTRSNVFAVWCTTGYFEVTNPGPYTDDNRPVLGTELGAADGTSIRHKFFAIVDRTHIGIDPTNAAGQAPRPVYLSFESDTIQENNGTIPAGAGVTVRVPALGQYLPAVPGTTQIYGVYDGIRWTMMTDNPAGTGGTNLRTKLLVDPGPNQEVFEVTNIAMLPGGQGADITLNYPTPPMTPKPHTRGCVMMMFPDVQQTSPMSIVNTANVPALGNPGPQPNFNYKADRYRAVAPLVVQVN